MSSSSIKLLVGFSQASASNIVAQLIAPALAEALNEQVEIVSIPGDNGRRVLEACAQAAPNGRTLCVSVPTHLTNGRYDLAKDFAPVGMIASNPLVLAVSNTLGVNTLTQFIDYVRARPDQHIYGASAIGGGPHLAAQLFCDLAQVRMRMQVYAETQVLYEDLAAGRIAATFNNPMSALPLAREGKITLLASTGISVNASVAHLPILATTLAGYRYESWVGLLAPSQTPEKAIGELNHALQDATQKPPIKQTITELGQDASTLSATDYANYLRTEQARWSAYLSTTRVTT